DVLVNNAGYGELGPVETIDEARVRKQYDTNVFGLLAVTKAFVGAMRERGAGRIINVSSVGGRVTFPLMGVYTSTKHAVEALSDALRIELRPFGVRVSVIQPGAIATEFSATALDTVTGLEGSPYAPLASRVDEIEGHFSAIEVGPEVIAAAIERAATSRWPRARYVAPFSAKLVLLFTAILPTSLLDWVYGRLTGLRRHALRPSPSEGALGAS
ncbi:MAG: SDR family NAD(P)-dependent oxidoreductase, partial [Myxococcales bacterium]|nr:SDR family NAD(P)-dependent oxidoreductase [Myxococcales bacterium]